MTGNVRVAFVDDLVIDEDTGEVLEWPQELRDLPGKAEYLAMRLEQAEDAYKVWRQYAGYLKQALGRLLDDAGVDSLRTAYGTVRWVAAVTRTGRVERLPQVERDYELSREQVGMILACAKSLDADLLEGLKQSPQFAGCEDAIAALIEERTARYVRRYPARRLPPEIRREELEPQEVEG